jgi:hypothetical protein
VLCFIAEMCCNIMSSGINVIQRTSEMFTGLIAYNCSFTNSNNLTIVYNKTLASCSVSEQFSNDTQNSIVNVTCNNIVNNAGRDWTFGLNRTCLDNPIIDELFTITLPPLYLNTTSFNISEDENFTAFVVVPDCKKIADPKYLVVRCNSSDMSNNTLSEDCTYTCSDLEAGSIYTASLVRLSIPKADKTNGNEATFPEESRNETYKIG